MAKTPPKKPKKPTRRPRPPHEPSAEELLQAVLRTIDDLPPGSPQYGQFIQELRVPMLSDAGFLITFLQCFAEPDVPEAAERLLDAMLEEARIDLENAGQYGARFLDMFADGLQACIRGQLFDTLRLQRFAAACQRNKIPVPEVLIQYDRSDFVDARTADVDPEALLQGLQRAVENLLLSGGRAYELFEVLDQASAALPAEVRAAALGELCEWEGEIFEACCRFFLLSPQVGLRWMAMGALKSRLAQWGLAGNTLHLLVLARTLLSDQSERRELDALIKQVRLQHMKHPPEPPEACEILAISATIADGAGAQSLAVGTCMGEQHQICMLLTKQGHGVKDAFVIPCEDREEFVERFHYVLAQSRGELITRETLEMFVEGALEDGLQQGVLPEPGLFDVIELSGLYALRPQVLSAEQLLARVDPEREIQDASAQGLGRWINHAQLVAPLDEVCMSWFEDSPETRDILRHNAHKPRKMTQLIRQYVDARREIWAQRFLQTAALCRDAEMLSEWRALAASAYGLLNGRELKRIPLMLDIVERTILAGLDQLDMN